VRLQFFIQAGHAQPGRRYMGASTGYRSLDEGVVLGDTPLYQIENEALARTGSSSEMKKNRFFVHFE